jgi:hypothetical protein
MNSELHRRIRPLAAVTALAAAGALCGAAPSPAPDTTVTMVCRSPLYLWERNMPLPEPSQISGGVGIGQTFTVLSHARISNRGTAFIRINVPVLEESYPDGHYWVLRDCAQPTIR